MTYHINPSKSISLLKFIFIFWQCCVKTCYIYSLFSVPQFGRLKAETHLAFTQTILLAILLKYSPFLEYKNIFVFQKWTSVVQH